MAIPSLGWQSWSPPIPSFLHFPPRDYPPSNYVPQDYRNTGKQEYLHITYWCSWYAYGWGLSPEIILKEANAIKSNQLGIDCILIDDGWSPDWIVPLSKKLHALGFQVGLWYSPFTRHNHLPLYETFDQLISDCHLDVLKLDFLYKPYFDHRISNPSKLLADMFTHLSVHYPRLITIGCGVPFQDAIGRVSAIRVSKDTAFPPYLPIALSRLIYHHRLKMLSKKYLVWKNKQLFAPDPDVRMFSLDTPETAQIWGKMPLKVKGIGDKVSRLNQKQIEKARIWLKK